MEKDTSKEAEGGSEDEVERSYHWRGMPPNGSHLSWGRGAGGSAAFAFNLVEHLSPRPSATGIGTVEYLAAFELFGLGRSQRDLVRFQTVPELLDKLETFVRGQVRKIEWGRTHDANIGKRGPASNRGAVRLTDRA